MELKELIDSFLNFQAGYDKDRESLKNVLAGQKSEIDRLTKELDSLKTSKPVTSPENGFFDGLIP